MLLSAENLYLKKGYNNKVIVKNTSFFLRDGEIVGLLGPNGAGKTSTFNMLVGIERCSSGHIYLDSDDITCFELWERARIGIGFLPQEHSIFRDLTVEENLILPLELQNLSKEQIRERVEYLLDRFKLNDHRKKRTNLLSGGLKRRVEIARLLCIKPKFMLFDEPYAGVDPKVIEYTHELLKELKKEGIGILITDHNIYETLSITDRSYIMNNGEIVMSGSTEELANNDYVKQIYLGENFKLR